MSYVKPAKASKIAEAAKTDNAISSTKPTRTGRAARIVEESRAARAEARAHNNLMSKRKRLLIRLGIITGGVIVIAAAIVLIAGSQYLKGIDKRIGFDDVAKDDLAKVLVKPDSPDDPYYVLLLGSDSRDDSDINAGRSDTIILARIDPVVPTVSLLSIPRDTMIELEGYGTQKINAAYAYYGPAGAVKAVSKLCDVGIAHYVEINFEGMTNLVDRLGGIEVKVPVYMEYKGDFLNPGKQYLNGAQALLMCRCRSFSDGDFTRMNNQKLVLQAITRDVLRSSKLELPSLVNELANCVRTDLSAGEAVGLLFKLQGMDTDKSLYMATIPSYSANIGGISYVVVDWVAFAVAMEQFKAGLPIDSDNLPVGEHLSYDDGSRGDEGYGDDTSGGGDADDYPGGSEDPGYDLGDDSGDDPEGESGDWPEDLTGEEPSGED